MARTYLPTMRDLLHLISVYVGRYQASLEAGMTPTQKTAFLAFIVCLVDLISALGPEPTNP
jgi:hypothetical protein